MMTQRQSPPVEIITNHVPRATLRWDELTDKERREFDYIDTPDRQDWAVFFRYRGWTYCLDAFTVLSGATDEFKVWDGYCSESYYSGVVVRLVDDGERVVVGFYVY